MKKIFLGCLLLVNISFCYEDLGTYGATHQIKEKHGLKEILKRQSDIDETKLIDDAKISFKKDLEVSSNIPVCQKSQQRVYEPLEILKEDVVMPYSNEVVRKAGKYNILEERKIFIPKYIFIINTEDEIQLELASTYYFGNPGLVEIYVANGNLSKLLDLGIENIYKMEDFVQKAYDIKCLPSIVTQQDFNFIITEYNPIELLKKVE